MGVFDDILKDIAADAIAKVSINKTWSEGKYQNTPKMVGAGVCEAIPTRGLSIPVRPI